MNTPTLPAPMPQPFDDGRWVPAPAVGLGRVCSTCCPPRYRGPDPRRWLDNAPRPDTVQLAIACRQAGYERHTATVLRAAGLTRQARLRAQQLFPFGLGPVLGDLMLPADGGGDMLRALTDVAESLFARRRPPRVLAVCPWGSADSAGCGRDPFGRLVHDHCRTATGPLPAWRTKSWARWTWRTAEAVDRLPAHLMRPGSEPAVEDAPRRIEAGRIGPVILLIGSDGPAQRARASYGALLALVLQLKPARLDDFAAIVMLHDHLRATPRTPSAWGWHGYAPRSLFTAALQARHASIHHGPDDRLVKDLACFLAPDRRPERVAQGLLEEGWDDQVYGNDALESRLRAAVRAATTADTELWEHTTQGQRLILLDHPDLLRAVRSAFEDELLVHNEEVDRALAKLKPEERKVAQCREAGLTWKQAALKAGQPTSMGERVRRKLKRLLTEDRRRRR
ncbi:hypothetical protein [Streptomyces sp. NPDC006551]|uniref:hypothetical protein n=1 Tax=Streptomyces sp. NPDC006551 TaxID=3157178 RepID=UPI0033A1B4C9